MAELGKTGLLGALVPEKYGGAALDYVSYALAVEELNRVDASVGITMWAHNSLCTNHIALFGSDEQKARYLPRLARGETLGAWALTEPGSGSDAAAMKTRAVREGDQFTLSGTKAFITNAGVGEVAVVMAVTDPARKQKGISAFILDKGLPGFSAGRPYRKLGLHASNTAELILDNVRVPAGQLCGELHMGFVNTMQVLEGGRVAMAAMAVGIAQGALDEALKYMKQRSAFGRTLAEFNGLQGMIADIGTEVEAARLLTLRAAALKDAGRPAKVAASMAKVFASEVAMKAATKSLQIHGGRRLHHGVPHRAHLPRRQAHRDRRRNLRGPADGDRARDPRIQIVGGGLDGPLRAARRRKLRRRSRRSNTARLRSGERD